MKNIIGLVDFSEMTNLVVKKAAEVAESFSSTLWLLHVADPEFDGFEAGPQLGCGSRPPKAQHPGTEVIEKFVRDYKAKNIEIKPLITHGPTITTILSVALRLKADLMVLGAHSHGKIHHAFVGSVSKELLHRSPCPLFLVPAQTLSPAGERE